jgi:hypothetical protein
MMKRMLVAMLVAMALVQGCKEAPGRHLPQKKMEDVLLDRRDDATERLLDYAENLKSDTKTTDKVVQEWRNGSVQERLIHSLVKGLDEFIEKAFIWCYYLRFEYQRLGFDSLDKYVVENSENNLFLKIKNAMLPKDVIKSQLQKLPTYQLILNFEKDDSRRMDQRIVKFFKDKHYYVN